MKVATNFEVQKDGLLSAQDLMEDVLYLDHEDDAVFIVGRTVFFIGKRTGSIARYPLTGTEKIKKFRQAPAGFSVTLTQGD